LPEQVLKDFRELRSVRQCKRVEIVESARNHLRAHLTKPVGEPSVPFEPLADAENLSSEARVERVVDAILRRRSIGGI